MNENKKNAAVKTEMPGEQGVARPKHLDEAGKKLNREDGVDVAELANEGKLFTNETCDTLDEDGDVPAGQAGG